MGTYVYTLRKKQVPIYVEGKKQIANLFDYAYKVSSRFGDDACYNRLVGRQHASANRAYEAYNGGYVLVSDGKSNHGAAVYRKVEKPAWVDTLDFPGEYVGQVDEFKVLHYGGLRDEMVS